MTNLNESIVLFRLSASARHHSPVTKGWSNQSYTSHLTISSPSGQCHSYHPTQDNIPPDLFSIPTVNSI